MEAAKVRKRRISISGMLKYLGVSCTGYRAFLKHKPSPAQQRKDAVKKDIRRIYDRSRQNYGAPRLLPSSVKKEPVLPSERLASTCVKWESGPNG